MKIIFQEIDNPWRLVCNDCDTLWEAVNVIYAVMGLHILRSVIFEGDFLEEDKNYANQKVKRKYLQFIK